MNTRTSADVKRPRAFAILHSRREFVQYPTGIQAAPDPIRQGLTPARPSTHTIAFFRHPDQREFGMLGGKFAYPVGPPMVQLSDAIPTEQHGLIYRPDFVTYAETVYG